MAASDSDSSLSVQSKSPPPKSTRRRKSKESEKKSSKKSKTHSSPEAKKTKCAEKAFAQAYASLMKTKVKTPSPTTVYAYDQASYQVALEELEKCPVNNLALFVGEGDRPLFVAFLKDKGGFVPVLALLHKGDLEDDQLRKFGYQEDYYQQDQSREPSPKHPRVGLRKVTMSMSDMEAIRRKGPLVLKRLKEAEEIGLSSSESYTLQEDESIDALQFRATLRTNFDGNLEIVLGRTGLSQNGQPVDNSYNQLSLSYKEMEGLIGWADQVFEELYRLTSSRIPVSDRLDDHVLQYFEAKLFKLLKNKVEDIIDDPVALENVVAETIRGAAKQFKTEIGASKWKKDVFQVFMALASTADYIEKLANKLTHHFEQ